MTSPMPDLPEPFLEGHFMVGVDADGNGPVEDPHHIVCACACPNAVVPTVEAVKFARHALAMVRLLVDEGHATPVAGRVFAKMVAEETGIDADRIEID